MSLDLLNFIILHKEVNVPEKLWKIYSETCLKGPLKNKQNKGLKAMW